MASNPAKAMQNSTTSIQRCEGIYMSSTPIKIYCHDNNDLPIKLTYSRKNVFLLLHTLAHSYLVVLGRYMWPHDHNIRTEYIVTLFLSLLIVLD